MDATVAGPLVGLGAGPVAVFIVMRSFRPFGPTHSWGFAGGLLW